MRVKHVSQKKQSMLSLFVFVISFVLLLGTIFLNPPTRAFSIGILSISVLIPFFLFLFLSIMSITFFVFKTMKHGIFLGSLGITYLLFQINGLTSPFFLLLLLALLIALELLFAPEKKQLSESE